MAFVIPEYGNLAAGDPQILLKIEGQVIGEDLDLRKIIQGFSYKESIKEKDVMELSLWDEEMEFSGHELFQSGNIITAQWGYRGNLSHIFRAKIMDIEPDYPASGKPTIRLRALDESCQMSAIKKQRYWKNPDPNPYIALPGIACSEVAEKIADIYGMGKAIYPSFNMGWKGNKGRHRLLIQFNESDEVFLTRMAAAAQWGPDGGQTGFVFYVEGAGGDSSILHFHPAWWASEEGENYELEYYSDAREGSLLSFTPRLNAESAKGAGTQVTARTFDPRQMGIVTAEEVAEESRGLIDVKANNDTTPAKEIHGPSTNIAIGAAGMGSWNEQNDIGEMILTGSSFDAPTPWAGDQAEEAVEIMRVEAEANYLKSIDDESDAHAVTLGIPRLRAKRFVNIVGVPHKYAGVYRVIECVHRVIPGYFCELKLKRRGQQEIEAADKTVVLKGRSYGVTGEW